MPQLVKMPPFPEVTKENVTDALLQWYYSLGWNEKATIDPKKIKIHQEDWNRICRQYIDAEGPKGGFFFMNYGPAADDSVKQGYMILEEGWIEKGVTIV